ncbi:MAG: transglutaminase family protein [Bryobacterales bacterium]|nr:transglutaminase family protein [Bryobacterales bacterium]
MILESKHTTTYVYSQPAVNCHSEVHLHPRSAPGQRVLNHLLTITPEPDFFSSRVDCFGNHISYFSIHEPHTTVTVISISRVELTPSAAPLPSLEWERVRELLDERATAEEFEACEFLFPSPHAHLGEQFAAYAAPNFPKRRLLSDAVEDLAARIHKEFRYDQRATTVATPVEQVLLEKRGVCQDFAHVMISCLRSLGLAARYVSGYLQSGEGSIGAEASHAWVSVFSPGHGWIDIDPTNNVHPYGKHVTVAWGRDYSDVTPVKGVALGGGDQLIDVAVSVLPSTA